MKYCSKCGNQIMDEAAICPNCGCAVEKPVDKSDKDTYDTLGLIAKIFMIISTVLLAGLLIPLAWCIPMTVSLSRKLKNGEKISTGFKVCTLIFVNIVAGILLLCMPEDN